MVLRLMLCGDGNAHEQASALSPPLHSHLSLDPFPDLFHQASAWKDWKPGGLGGPFPKQNPWKPKCKNKWKTFSIQMSWNHAISLLSNFYIEKLANFKQNETSCKKFPLVWKALEIQIQTHTLKTVFQPALLMRPKASLNHRGATEVSELHQFTSGLDLLLNPLNQCWWSPTCSKANRGPVDCTQTLDERSKIPGSLGFVCAASAAVAQLGRCSADPCYSDGSSFSITVVNPPLREAIARSIENFFRLT